MPAVTETAEFSNLRLHSTCYSMFYWLKYTKKIGLHRDTYLEKALQIPWKNLGDPQGPQATLWEAILLRIFWCVWFFSVCMLLAAPTTVLTYRHSNLSRYNRIHWLFKSFSGFPEGGSPTMDGPPPSFSSNSSLSEQVWNELVNCRKGHAFL